QGRVDLFRRGFLQRRPASSQGPEGRLYARAIARAQTRAARALRAVESANGRRRECIAVARRPPLKSGRFVPHRGCTREGGEARARKQRSPGQSRSGLLLSAGVSGAELRTNGTARIRSRLG